MEEPQSYTEAVRSLRTNLLRAANLAAVELPDTLDPASDFAQCGGAAHDNPTLRALAKSIDEALAEFDRVQSAIGLLDRFGGRYGRFLKGDGNRTRTDDHQTETTS